MYLFLVVEQIYRFKASVIFFHLPLRRAACVIAHPPQKRSTKFDADGRRSIRLSTILFLLPL